MFCWLDKWHGMTMKDIREIEDRTKRELDEVSRFDNFFCILELHIV